MYKCHDKNEYCQADEKQIQKLSINAVVSTEMVNIFLITASAPTTGYGSTLPYTVRTQSGVWQQCQTIHHLPSASRSAQGEQNRPGATPNHR